MRSGTWISRDPLSDYSFLVQQLGTQTAEPPSRISRDALSPQYLFVANDPQSKTDATGLTSTTFTWNSTPCANGLTAFIQVGHGGSRLLGIHSPFVDDGTHGLLSDEPNCPPFYPSSTGSWFEDTAGNPNTGSTLGLNGLTFEVCQVCLQPCFCQQMYKKGPTSAPTPRPGYRELTSVLAIHTRFRATAALRTSLLLAGVLSLTRRLIFLIKP